MKINWGTGIALVYGVFALSMIGAVIASRSHDPRLVQQDYYTLDLNYQERLERKQNTAALPQDLLVRFDREARLVALQFPTSVGTPSGTVKFSQAAEGTDDFELPVQVDANGLMQVPSTKLPEGRWHVEVVWDAGGKKFYQETVVTIAHV
jgi:nitrogen fixation protein FixH